jgi:colanic acid biosynthesis glycosyl transferase WcaI
MILASAHLIGYRSPVAPDTNPTLQDTGPWNARTKRMKILVISLYYEPDLCQGNGPLVRALCDDWAAAGHEVSVVTSFPHYNCDAVWPEYQGKLWQHDRVGWVNVLRSYIYVSARKSGLARMLNYLSFNVSSTLAGLSVSKPDVIFVLSPPLTIGLTAYLVGKLKGVPYCYNVQDIWPEAAVRLGMLQGERTIRFWEWVERFIYQRARRIFAISEEFTENLQGKGVPAAKIEVIPNFVDTDFIRPLPRQNAFGARHGLNDKFVVLYAGNVGLSQGLEVVLEAAELLRNQPEVLFQIVGAGSSKADLVAEAERRQLSNVQFLPLQAEADVPELYAACDVALIPLRRGLAQNSVPCKTYSIMSSARPYIASVDEGSNVWKLTERANCGVCVPPENARALAEAVLELKADRKRRQLMGVNGRAFVEWQFAREVVTQRYRRALEELVEPHRVRVQERMSLETRAAGSRGQAPPAIEAVEMEVE